MARPLFGVGEEVLLCSREVEVVNYETTIMAVRWHSQHGYGYIINPEPPTENAAIVYIWKESLFKNRYQPGDSFDTFMDKLKQPIMVTKPKVPVPENG